MMSLTIFFNQKITFVITAVILLITLFYNYKPQQRPVAPKLVHPQEYMIDAHVTHYTEQGLMKDQIAIKHWAYNPTLQKSVLSLPKLSLFKTNGAIWRVQAEHGQALHPTLQSKVTRLDLWENVVVDRLETSTVTPVTATTTKLYYYPDTEKVETDAFVTIDKPGLNITGDGLEGYLNKNKLEIRKNVTTRYQTG